MSEQFPISLFWSVKSLNGYIYIYMKQKFLTDFRLWLLEYVYIMALPNFLGLQPW